MNMSMKSFRAATFFVAIGIFGIAAILLSLAGDTHASSTCQLSLPPSPSQPPVTMTVDADSGSCDLLPTTYSGYVSATFSNIPDGCSISNGLPPYSGMCADLEGWILDSPSSGAIYQVHLLSSVDNPNSAPPFDRPWNNINYILNHYPIPDPDYSWLDVQAAIWQLTNPQPSPTLPYGCAVDEDMVNAILLDANNNGDAFIPGYNDLVAIIIDPQSCTGNTSNYCCYPPNCTHLPFQILFTTATCVPSYTVTPLAGEGGSIDPSDPQTVNHNATTSFTITADPHYHAVMLGTCGGNLVGTTYTTNPITAACTVTATFALSPVTSVRIDPTTLHSAIQAAFSDLVALTNGGTIRAWDYDFTENLTFNRGGWLVNLKGGYDTNFINKQGYTRIHGVLTIQSGTLVVENIIIK